MMVCEDNDINNFAVIRANNSIIDKKQHWHIVLPVIIIITSIIISHYTENDNYNKLLKTTLRNTHDLYIYS